VEQAEFPRFNKLVVELFAKYPQSAMSEATISAYWRELRKYESRAVEWAFANVGKGRVDFCPSAEAVRECAELEHKRLETIRKRAARGVAPPERQLGKGAEPPIHPDWSALASYWEQENKHYAAHPEERPEDLTQQRFKQFWKLWGRVVEGKVMT
jgi:hypothetical protein